MNSSTVVMRELKDGSGYSECRSSEENVGKRRCNHVHSSVSFNVQVNKIGPSVKEVIVSDDYNKLEKRDKETVVKAFISSLTPIDEEKLSLFLNNLEICKGTSK